VFKRQKWRKLGRIYCPDGSHPLMRSHASVPCAEHVGGDVFRIYFSSRDELQRSRTFSLVVDLGRPHDILELRDDPLLDLGELGGFDDSGAMLTWITPLDAETRLFYFIGWNRRVTIPFQNALGVARVAGDRVVERFRGPTIDRTLEEPHFVASACVVREADRFRCWYLSCVGWDPTPAGPRHRYHIKYAESADGLHWRRTGRVAIDLAGPEEFAISRPSVVFDGGRYRMWFSCRGAQYRIGYAESADGLEWRRDDRAVGLAPSGDGWDGAAVAYGHVFEHRGRLLMLYNGNDYGRTGLGLAELP
jgi:hypothetical protein